VLRAQVPGLRERETTEEEDDDEDGGRDWETVGRTRTKY
jgi:hypothetical protein